MANQTGLSAPRISIRNGHVVDPSNQLDATIDIHIANGKIVAIGSPPDGFVADIEIHAEGLTVIPGIIDLSARLRKDDLRDQQHLLDDEAVAAAHAGITTFCCPPDMDPIIDSSAVTEVIRQHSSKRNTARILPIGALTQGLGGEKLTEMAALKQAGCVAISNGLSPIQNTQVLRRAMAYAATHGLTVFILAQDYWLSQHGCVHDGIASSQLGLNGIPETAETVIVARDLELIEETGVKSHFCRLSSARSIDMIAKAQQNGLPVSADVSAHHLHLTEMEVIGFNSYCHVIPPLRAIKDRDALRAGLKDNKLQAICSDHSPLGEDAKQAPFPMTLPGISGLDTLLPLALKLYHDGTMTLPAVIARLTSGPAQILAIASGQLAVGDVADICIFDINERWSVTPKTMASISHITPFLNTELIGRVHWTLLNGKVIFSRNISHGAKS